MKTEDYKAALKKSKNYGNANLRMMVALIKLTNQMARRFLLGLKLKKHHKAL